jgi:hypothetical protein
VEVVPDCFISVVAAPATQTVQAGSAATIRATAVRAGCGPPPRITWSAAGPGTATFSNERANVSGDATDSIVSVFFSRAGQYAITASSGEFSHQVRVLVVDAPCDVQISAEPITQRVKVGEPATITAFATRDGVCTGPMIINWSGTGPGLFEIGTAGGATLANAASFSTTAKFTGTGTYLITVTATSGSASKQTTVNVLVDGEPSICSLTLSVATATQTVPVGGAAILDAVATKAPGSGGGLTVTWAAERADAVAITGASRTTAADDLKLSTMVELPAAGSYLLTGRAVSGACAVERTLRINAVAPPPGTLSVRAFPRLQSVKAGDAVSFTGVAARSADLLGPMALQWTASGADGAVVTLSNSSAVTDGLSATLTAAAVFPHEGTYTVVFTGGVGSRTETDWVHVLVVPSKSPCPFGIAATPARQTILLGTVAAVQATASRPACLPGSMTVTWTGPRVTAFRDVSASGPADNITLSADAVFSRPGIYNLTAIADVGGHIAETSVTVEVQKLNVAADLPVGTSGESYRGRFRVLNSSGPTFLSSITAGSLPPGLSLGHVSGDPLAITGSPSIGTATASKPSCAPDPSNSDLTACSFNARFTDAATGATNCVDAEDCDVFNIRVRSSASSCGGPRLDRFEFPKHCSVVAGTGFNIGARGAVEPLDWTVNGIRLSGQRAARASIPVAASLRGPVTMTVAVQDACGLTDSATYEINVVQPFSDALSIQTLPDATVGIAYSESLRPNNGTPAYRWAASDSIPAGLTLTAEGGLTGMPQASGLIRATVIDGSGNSCAQNLVFEATEPLSIDNAPLPTGNVNVPYRTDLTVRHGKPPYDWFHVGGPAAGGTPEGCPEDAVSITVPGLALTRSGSICGVPRTTGTFTLELEVRDSGNVRLSDGATGPRRHILRPTITIRNVQFTPPVLNPAVPQVAYSQEVTAEGASGMFHWESKPECRPAAGRIVGIPAWLNAAAFDGPSYRLTGIPDPADWDKTYCFSIEVSEAGALPVTREFELKVLACPTLSTPTAVPESTLDVTATFPGPGYQVTSLSQTFSPDRAVQGSASDPAWTILQPLRLRLGTVAGTSALSSEVTWRDIRYSCPDVAHVRLPTAEPVLRSCAGIATTGSGFTITVRGFSSTRQITDATFTFEPRPGRNLPRRDFTIPAVQDLFGQHFTGGAADGRGTFTYEQQFNTKDIRPDDIAAVTIVLRNAVGASQPLRVVFEDRVCPAQ